MRMTILVAGLLALLTLAIGCGQGGQLAPPTPSAEGELAREQVIEHALASLSRDPEIHVDRSTTKATRMTESEADELIRQKGGPEGRRPSPEPDRPVWLVEFKGECIDFRGFGLPTLRPRQVGTYFLIVSLDGRLTSGTCVPD